jgi:hypothetical protein
MAFFGRMIHNTRSLVLIRTQTTTSQILAQLRASYVMLYWRSTRRNELSEEEKASLLHQASYTIGRSAPSRRMLTDFLNLQGASANDVLKYAQHHGVLDICNHGEPHGHHRSCAPDGWPLEGWTSFEAWQTTANRHAALLRIAAELRDTNSVGAKEDWAVLFSSVHDEASRAALQIVNREHALNMLHGLVNDYLRRGEVHPELSRTPGGWKIQLSSNALYPLLGNLAAQLALVVSGAEAIYTCAGCGVLYFRDGERRRPKRGTGNYCDACGRPKQLQSAKQRYRNKILEARRMQSQGLSLERIAVTLKSDRGKVQKWLAK